MSAARSRLRALRGGLARSLRRLQGSAITIVFGTVLVTFLIGVAMQGPLYHPGLDGGDVLSRLIQFGGWIGDMAAGVFYFVASFMGYAPPDVAGYSPDYGSKFIVAAGLLNILAIVDAYEITTRQKD